MLMDLMFLLIEEITNHFFFAFTPTFDCYPVFGFYYYLFVVLDFTSDVC
jgi:hypothetical protein